MGFLAGLLLAIILPETAVHNRYLSAAKAYYNLHVVYWREATVIGNVLSAAGVAAELSSPQHHAAAVSLTATVGAAFASWALRGRRASDGELL